ncbi:hypothetical protein DSL72_003933 [Monilinia vaccinii-corymbosi]|uniref:Uncharacterized protein n=1 Tax=Monilinia vaccinii-corymbosi TaxID=61207 RepID=A0A8A3P8D3_9HELO|nr:hypothetical protein DSL72_003933 [Monilinia vaccinii-corymbosi]
MASSSNNRVENNPRSSSSLSSPKDTMPPSPFDAIPSKLTATALLAIPFISILVGVSSIHPTKAIYAVYSPNTASLQYVHGDGTFISPLSLCPLLSFNNGDTLCSRQRLNIIECMTRSARYYAITHDASWHDDGPHEREFKDRFTNAKSVAEAMTYLSDLHFGPDSIAALRTIPLDRHLTTHLPDRSDPCVPLTAHPTWNFSVHRADLADPRLDPRREDGLMGFFHTLVRRYRSPMPYATFKKAAYVLSGLEKVGAVSWRGGREGVKTRGGWTVDDFLARFAQYEQFTAEWRFLHAPSPIAWLEAELADELRRERLGGRRRKVPWKGLMDGVRVVEVVGWEVLGGIYWDDGEDGRGYPSMFECGEAGVGGDDVDIEMPIKNEESGEIGTRNGHLKHPKHVGELRKKTHGKKGKRRREERDEGAAPKRVKSAALNIISNVQ